MKKEVLCFHTHRNEFVLDSLFSSSPWGNLNLKRAAKCDYVIFTLNKHSVLYREDIGPDPVISEICCNVKYPFYETNLDNDEAFLIGKISSIQEFKPDFKTHSSSRTTDNFYVINFSEAAHISIPDLYKFRKNPVSYFEEDVILNHLSISSFNDLDWHKNKFLNCYEDLEDFKKENQKILDSNPTKIVPEPSFIDAWYEGSQEELKDFIHNETLLVLKVAEVGYPYRLEAKFDDNLKLIELFDDYIGPTSDDLEVSDEAFESHMSELNFTTSDIKLYPDSRSDDSSDVKGLTFEEAKLGLSKQFNIPANKIEIILRG